MTETARTVLRHFEIRKSRKQKEDFCVWLCEQLTAAGYAPKTETGGRLIESRNVVVGDPDGAELLLTAHYDTCAVLPFPNFITPRNMPVYILFNLAVCLPFLLVTTAAEIVMALLGAPLWLTMAAVYAILLLSLWLMLAGKANRHTANDNTSGVMTLLEIALTLPEKDREKACFVFFDNEEKGLFGSAAFVKQHPKAKKEALCLNFDCVSDGDDIQLYPMSTVKKDKHTAEKLQRAFRSAGDKRCEVVEGFAFYPSDQKHFRRGVGICALKKNRLVGYYMNRIHTPRDTVMDERNIELLRESVLRFLAEEEKETYAG